MKRILTILCLALLPFFTVSVCAQDTIAAWSFPSTSADSLPEKYIPINSASYISCQYGTFGAPTYVRKPIDYTTNGSQGAPDKCGKTVGWDNGTDSTAWMIFFKTTGYTDLKLSSKIQAGGSNPGPRDFQIQWKLAGSNVWTDVAGGTLTCANNWTSAAVSNLSIPSNCDDQSNDVYIRWVVKSNLDINGNTLLAAGISKIDDIIITGSVITGITAVQKNNSINIYPNPSDGSFNIENTDGTMAVHIYDVLGNCVLAKEGLNDVKTVISDLIPGLFLVSIRTSTEKNYSYRIIVN